MTVDHDEDRREVARQIREDAARTAYLVPEPAHLDNGDEERYQNKIGSSTKGLAHDPATGEVVPSAYHAMLEALRSGSFEDFETLVGNGHFGCPDPTRRRRFVNPHSAYAFDLEGIDSHQLAEPPAPEFASAQEAGEMVELYWMALLRDTPFAAYDTEFLALEAASDLSSRSDFRGPSVAGAVTQTTLFRDGYPGCTDGPYVSQFLLQPIDIGAQRLDTTIASNTPGVDFATTFPEWLDVINGCQPWPSVDIATGPRVFCHTGRDLAQYVHRDVPFQAYLVAGINLLVGGYPADRGNPYGQFIDASGTGLPLPAGVSGAVADVGFGTFGAPWITAFVCEVATRALKHQWYQKWLVHRRLRPEEFGGHLEAQRLNKASYPFADDLFTSTVLGQIEAKFGGTHLLPQAFPEGSPLHTSYGSGHATVAGACVTVLKWFFDESAPIKNPVIPHPDDATKLIAYVAPPGEPTLTVGGELNKLASNISQGRDIAGVHWRSDANEANTLGEQVAIDMIKELPALTNEPYGGMTLTRFDGTTLTI
jgi:membrane-associated phospholipid phosphatase